MRSSQPQHWALAALVLGLLHRAFQLWLVAGAVTRQAALNPTWQSMQYLPADLLERNFPAALLYLQQTPPLPHLLVGALYRLSGDPAVNALALIGFCGILSCIGAGLLVLLLSKLRIPPPLAFAAAMLLLGSSGVVLLEYTAFGQCFYEQLTMVGCLAAALAAVSLVQQRSLAAALWFGVVIALLALTRATFSYFFLLVVAWLAWCRLPPKYLLAFLLPVALLHGGWAAKQYVVQGYWSTATSSWGGANMQGGGIKRHDRGFADSQPAVSTPCAARWPHVFDPAMPIFFSFAKYAQKLDSLLAEDTALGPSPAARAIDAAAYRARGQWLANDSAAFRELSACVQQMYFRYWLRDPGAALQGWAMSYALFWQPMDSYTSVIPTMLVASRPAAGGATVGDALSGQLQSPGYFARQEKMPWHLGADKALLVPVNVAVIPFAPQLATLLAFVLLHSLPLLAALFCIEGALINRTESPGRILQAVFPAGFSFLPMIYVYVAGVCNLVEYGENMRFRLAVEPIVWSIGLVVARAVLARFRAGRGGGQPAR